MASKVTCYRNHTFNELWKESFIEIKVPLTIKDATDDLEEPSFLDTIFYNENNITPHTITSVLKSIDSKIPILFIFDEFDSLLDNSIKEQFADTIKALSDNVPNVTIIIVGIASNVNQLIGSHPSIERCTTQARVPLMSQEDLGEIIDKGLETLKMSINSSVRRQIIGLSQGFPHFTHLLTKYSAESAIDKDKDYISKNNFGYGINASIDNTFESIKETYRCAISTTRKETNFKDVVIACAFVETDEYATFRPTDLEEPLLKLTDKALKQESYIYYIRTLCQPEKGSLLEKIGTKNHYRYRFKNPMVRAYIAIKYCQKLIEESHEDLTQMDEEE